MKNLKYGTLLALVLIASIRSLQAGSPPTRITSSQAITVPGNYLLANDITVPINGIGIHIQASDVTLNLNGHTINASQGNGIVIDYQFDAGLSPVINARVSNGRIVAAGSGVAISGSECLITGLNITTNFIGFNIDHGQFNRVQNCVLTGQQARKPFSLFLTSHNTIQNCTLAGTFLDTIEEQDQAGAAYTVIGNNTFSGIQWASPTL